VNVMVRWYPCLAWGEIADPVSVKPDNLRDCEAGEAEAGQKRKAWHQEE
jgi:hypothetical protein